MSAAFTFNSQNGKNLVQHIVADIPVALGFIATLNPSLNAQFLSFGISPAILGFIVSIVGYAIVEYISADGNLVVTFENTVKDVESLTPATSPITVDVPANPV